MIDYGLAKRRAMIAATGEALKLTQTYQARN